MRERLAAAELVELGRRALAPHDTPT